MNIGDNDRLVTIMTKDYGVIRAFARGVKSIKSRRASATGLLSYSNFNIEKKGDTYKIIEASVNHVFFGLSGDFEVFSISQYFCELSNELCPEDDTCAEFLRLILNSLYFLNENSKSPLLVKAITELRICAISGYMPNLIACDGCGKFEDNFMYFKLDTGSLYCQDCNKNENTIKISLDILKAMRHIVYSPFNNIYSFTLSDDNVKLLSDIAEKYICYQTERTYKTLEIYRNTAGI